MTLKILSPERGPGGPGGPGGPRFVIESLIYIYICMYIYIYGPLNLVFMEYNLVFRWPKLFCSWFGGARGIHRAGGTPRYPPFINELAINWMMLNQIFTSKMAA